MARSSFSSLLRSCLLAFSGTTFLAQPILAEELSHLELQASPAEETTSASHSSSYKDLKKRVKHGEDLTQRLKDLHELHILGSAGDVLAQMAYVEMGLGLLEISHALQSETADLIHENAEDFYHKAVDYFQQNPANSELKYQLAKMHEAMGEETEARALLTELLDQKYAKAQYRVFRNPALHPEGQLTDLQRDQLLEEAANSDMAPVPRAMLEMAHRALEKDNMDSARAYYQAAYNHGDKTGFGSMGLGYLALHHDRNPKEAAQYFKEAVKKGNPMAMISLAIMYAGGVGLKENDKKARALLLEAADKHKSMLAAAILAEYALKGVNMPINKKKARRYLEQALAHEEPYAYYVEGWRLTTLPGFVNKPKLIKQAKDHLEVASHLGITAADIVLANLYVQLDNPVKAQEAFVKAANQGNPMAQYQLGLLYKMGYFGPDKHRQALKLLVEAGDQGILVAKVHAADLQHTLQNIPQAEELLYEVLHTAPHNSPVAELAEKELVEIATAPKADIEPTPSPEADLL